VGFEPTISAGERPKTYALDRAVNGTGGVTVTNVYYFQSHTKCFITIVFYMATSFGPECWPSSGHYTRTRIYTETLVYRKVQGLSLLH